MSILDVKSPKIRPMLLRELGYELIGWGSPMTRKEKNTKCYELVGSFDEDGYDIWDVIWFPKKFEGRVNPGTCYSVDVRGRIMMSKVHLVTSTYYMSPPVSTMDDLHIFIDRVISGHWPTVREMLKTGDLKYL